MDSIKKFMEAAKAFQSDELYLNFRNAKKENDEDPKLQEAINEFNLVRVNLNNEIEKEDRDEDKVAEMNTQINNLYNSIMNNEKMLAYSAAKEEVESFVEYINAIINEALDGGDPFSVEKPTPHDCGEGGCASCSGCH